MINLKEGTAALKLLIGRKHKVAGCWDFKYYLNLELEGSNN